MKNIISVFLVTIICVMALLPSVCVNADSIDVKPDMPKNIDAIISEAGQTTQYGLNAGYSFTGTQNPLAINPSVDLSNSDFIEFDVYISDYENFQKFENGEHICVFFSTANSIGGGTFASFDLNSCGQVTKQGWNHCKFKKTDAGTRGVPGGSSYPWSINWTTVMKVTVAKYQYKSGEAYNFTATGNLRIANICGTIAELNAIPNLPVSLDKIISTNGITLSYGNSISLKHDAGAAYVTSTNLDLSTSECIEFDVYVGNIDVFNQYAGQVALYLSLTESTSGGCSNRHADYDLETQVKKSGWNHVKLAISDFCTRGQGGKQMTFTNVQRVGIHSWTDGAKTCSLGTDTIRVANICGTFNIPDVADNATVINGYKAGKWGANYNYVNDNSLMTFATPIDISDSKYIEFDFYVENYDHFRSAVPNADAWFRLYICTQTGNANARRALYSFDDQVTKTGWNHIKLLKSSYGQRGGDGGPIFSSVCYARIGFWSNTSANSYCANEVFKIANLSGSNNETGDVNGDKSVDILDLVSLEYSNIGEKESNFFCDVNYDYTFNDDDVTYLNALILNS